MIIGDVSSKTARTTSTTYGQAGQLVVRLGVKLGFGDHRPDGRSAHGPEQ